MKAISLWQPWASLMAIGEKVVETRSWPTLHRGPLVICSTKSWNRDVLAQLHAAHLKPICDDDSDWRRILAALDLRGIGLRDLPLGQALCVVHLADCQRVERIEPQPWVTEDELAFGDYTPGRFGWITERLRPLNPFPVQGKRGLWDIPDEAVQAAQLSKE